MPKRRSDGKPLPVLAGRVKTASRVSGGASAPVLTRPESTGDPLPIRSPLTVKTVAHYLNDQVTERDYLVN